MHEHTVIGYLLLAALVTLAIAAYFLCKAVVKSANPLAKIVDARDVQIDDSEIVKYKGLRVGDMNEKIDEELTPEGSDKLPNGATGPSYLPLGNDCWLISGGKFEADYSKSTANYLFRNKVKHFQLLSPMLKGRDYHSLLKLASGNILIFGGIPQSGYENSIELLDIKNNRCSIIGQLTEGRVFIASREVSPNKVLAVGGQTPERKIVELIDVDKRTCTKLGELNIPRGEANIFRIDDKNFLVLGGINSSNRHGGSQLPPEIITLPSGHPD